MNHFSSEQGEEARQFVESQSSGKGARYLRSHCATHPESRFVRKHTVESMSKAKEPAYFANLLENVLKIDPKTHLASAISQLDGTSFSPARPLGEQKELLLIGALKKEFLSIQEELVRMGIYPDTLQLGSASALGAVKSYLSWKELDETILILELGEKVSQLFILSGQKLELCRSIPFGEESMIPAIQRELGLRDEESARKLFHSSTFDFTEMGSSLLRKALKELQASTGFFEVQTGRSIPNFYLTQLGDNHNWIPGVIEREIGIQFLHFDLEDWLKGQKVELGEDVDRTVLGPSTFSLLSLLVDFGRKSDGAKK